ncbi:MAG: NAD(P)H-hydrate epimerase, partial [Limisphaerales bacterium]
MPEPIVSVAGMRAREERTWAAGVKVEAVIRRAGLAVAAAARRMSPAGGPLLVLAGRGHNGDDAEVAAGELSDREPVLVRLRASDDSRAFDRARSWLRAHRGQGDALIVDGLFGIGLNRPLEGPWADLVGEVNDSGIPVLAVDCPSGLDADTGRPLGCAVKSARTVTLGAVKWGLLADGAADHVGRLELARDIGLLPGEGEATAWWTLAEDFVGFPPRRPESAHKGTFGHVGIVAGSFGFHGAAVLAARGALRARPGLVTVLTEESVHLPVASSLSAAMVRPWTGGDWDAGGITALVVGPGLASSRLSPAWRSEMVRIWREALCPVVVDASALDWLPAGGRIAGLRVVTPHPGEAGRLLGVASVEVQDDRMDAMRRLLARWDGADLWGVLKGRHTLVGA